MKNFISPLRYPGGKARIDAFMEDLILLNNLENCVLYEMYAGGAGAALSLLFSNTVSKIVLNDLDRHIYAFWYAVLFHTEEFIRLIEATQINMNSWRIQREIYENWEQYDNLSIGFSSFFLNRCNRSGVFNAGPIGGKNQNGNYLIDARFNKDNLIRRIEAIGQRRDSIQIENRESITFLKEIFVQENENYLIFLDPPYYAQGENLYFNFYKDENHSELASLLQINKDKSWFLTYDNSERIKHLYSNSRTAYLPMTYSLQEKRKSKEIMMFSENLVLPKQLRMGNKKNRLTMLDF